MVQCLCGEVLSGVELVGKSWVRWNSVASFVICVLESWATEGSSADEQIDGAVDVILY
jgi:hypothetical protein